MKNKILILIGILVILLAVVGVSVAVSGRKENSASVNADTADKTINVVASFYPIYVIAENLTEGVSGITLSNLTPNQTGCLHDYQITTGDMKKLENADVLLLNGGGMETFVERVATEMPTLKLIYSDEGIDMYEGEEHEEHEEEDEDHEGHHHEEEENAHVWLDPNRYIKQIENLAKGLSEADPANKALYEANRDAYIEKVKEVQARCQTEFAAFSSVKSTIIFHDAFDYLQEYAPVSVEGEVEVEGDDSALSAAELAEVIELIHEKDIDFIIVEEQHKLSIADRIAEETGCEVMILDSLVTGDGDKDSWINGMNENITKLTLALQAQHSSAIMPSYRQ